jgi:hypothetical protein
VLLDVLLEVGWGVGLMDNPILQSLYWPLMAGTGLSGLV